MKEVALIPTGIANLASVKASFARLGANVSEVISPEKILRADFVVLPGVGSFGPGASFLHETGLADSLKERVNSDRPTLCICLGFQLLGRQSEESAGFSGLSLFQGDANHFPPEVTTPQFGWNVVTANKNSKFLHRSGYAYFANSYYLAAEDKDWTVSTATETVEFVAAMEQGSTLACQFHPELSGKFGEEILSNWLA